MVSIVFFKRKIKISESEKRDDKASIKSQEERYFQYTIENRDYLLTIVEKQYAMYTYFNTKVVTLTTVSSIFLGATIILISMIIREDIFVKNYFLINIGLVFLSFVISLFITIFFHQLI